MQEEHYDRHCPKQATDDVGEFAYPLVVRQALTWHQSTFVQVVQHMGTMDQPWHCPHGRPTMRHLSDIAGIGWDGWGGPRKVDWEAFCRSAATTEA